MRSAVLASASMFVAVLRACAAALLAAVPGDAQTTSTVTLVGAGDIAGCSQTNDSATARLLGRIVGTVITLGDNVQGQGARSDFRNCYDPTWGKFKKRTRPTAGDHEDAPTGAKPYFDYFGWRARPRRGYYAYERGSWHKVALNSNCDRKRVGGCGRTSPQGRWLRNNLNNHPAADGIRCVTICPRGFDTAIAREGEPSERGYATLNRVLTARPRLASPAEMATIALFCASDEASFLNGP